MYSTDFISFFTSIETLIREHTTMNVKHDLTTNDGGIRGFVNEKLKANKFSY